MRLYLSSFKIGNHPEKLVELTGLGKNVAVILNALDHKPETRDKFLLSEIKMLSDLGFKPEELDLQNYFGKADKLEKYLRRKDLVWINGGNTFLLRRAMKQSGFDRVITRLLREDAIVYAGFSAACAVLHKDLHGVDFSDDPKITTEGYDKKTEWSGLGLIDFSIAVHYNSDHPESEETDREIDYYKRNNIPFQPLRDGEVIIINGDKTEIIK
ncbi:MAG: serine peptidase [Caldithrix sp.]|nr:serine peptidase [Caldithrix sp.]